MALQKRRLGRSRIHSRRSAWMRSQSNSPEIGKCSNCGEHKLPHRVCEACGHYGGNLVVEVAQEGFEE